MVWLRLVDAILEPVCQRIERTAVVGKVCTTLPDSNLMALDTIWMLFGRRCRMAQAKVLTGGCGYVPTTALRLLGYLVVMVMLGNLETCCQKNSKNEKMVPGYLSR
jgi:hypothetical protein